MFIAGNQVAIRSEIQILTQFLLMQNSQSTILPTSCYLCLRSTLSRKDLHRLQKCKPCTNQCCYFQEMCMLTKEATWRSFAFLLIADVIFNAYKKKERCTKCMAYYCTRPSHSGLLISYIYIYIYISFIVELLTLA